MTIRRKRVLRGLLLILLLGGLYACFVRLTGFGIPCPFRSLTGLQCPGCGVSRMCMALLRLDLPAAFAANAAILCLLPLLLVTALRMLWLYVRFDLNGSRMTNVSVCLMIGVLLIFGVLRNTI